MSRIEISPPGHPPEAWAPTLAAAPHVAAADLIDAYAAAHLILLSAHPDDETIGCGRLAAAWARRAPVTGVLATAGEACVDGHLPRPAGLAERRQAEWREALTRLGGGCGPAYGLPDGRLSEHEDELVELVQTYLATIDNGPIVLAATSRDDPHPDHRAVGRAAARVAERLDFPLLEYPVWMTFWADPATALAPNSELIVVDLDVDADRARRAALDAYVSQLTPLDDRVTAVVPPEMIDAQTEQLLIRSRDAA